MTTTLLLLLLNFNPIVNQNTEGAIIWSADRSLTWADFQGQPSNEFGADIKALTTSHVTYTFQSEGTTLSFNLQVWFSPSESWVRSGSNSSELLQHEQCHFDLAEYQGRLLREKIETTKYSSINTIVDDIAQQATEVADEVDKLQDQYDHETDHSRNKEEQKIWEDKIAGLLKSKEAYASGSFSIDIAYLMK